VALTPPSVILDTVMFKPLFLKTAVPDTGTPGLYGVDVLQIEI